MEAIFDIGDVLALSALMVSVYVIWKTNQFNKVQKTLIESQKTLNARLLEKEEGEVQDAKKADLDAKFIKVGSNLHRLKISNKGKAPAYNVQIYFPDDNDVFIDSEIAGKFPVELLERHGSVELNAAFSMQSKPKHTIRLIWSDNYADNNVKTLYPTI